MCRRGGMVDTIDSKSIAREGVRVQVSSPVKKVTDTSAKKTPRNRCGVFNFSREPLKTAVFRGNFKNAML